MKPVRWYEVGSKASGPRWNSRQIQQFNDMITRAFVRGIPVRDQCGWLVASGPLAAAHDQFVRVEATCEPQHDVLRVHATLADKVRATSVEFFELLFRVISQSRSAKPFWSPEDGVLGVESYSSLTPAIEYNVQSLGRMLEDMKHALSQDMLWAALAMADARLWTRPIIDI